MANIFYLTDMRLINTLINTNKLLLNLEEALN